MKISYFAFSVIFVGCSSYLKLPMKYIFVLQKEMLWTYEDIRLKQNRDIKHKQRAIKSSFLFVYAFK